VALKINSCHHIPCWCKITVWYILHLCGLFIAYAVTVWKGQSCDSQIWSDWRKSTKHIYILMRLTVSVQLVHVVVVYVTIGTAIQRTLTFSWEHLPRVLHRPVATSLATKFVCSEQILLAECIVIIIIII